MTVMLLFIAPAVLVSKAQQIWLSEAIFDFIYFRISSEAAK